MNRGTPKAVVLVLGLLAGCTHPDPRTVVTLWHQMRPAEGALLQEAIERFEALHPGIDVRVLYKETEELRSGFEAAALAGIGPELIYGPSDVIELYQTMGIIQDMSPWIPQELQQRFVDGALTFLPSADGAKLQLLHVADRVGNHLALVYNRNLIAEPPRTTDDLIRVAQDSTRDIDGDGRIDQFGLVWNYVEPFFSIPFLTGFGAWVFAEGTTNQPALDTPEAVDGLEFMASLRDQHGVAPKSCDYETADALFKEGRAAMIINGDWSWGDYLTSERIDAAIALLPIVNQTGLPMRPMFASKGYSLNVNASGKQANAAMELVRFLTSPETQRKFQKRLKTLPSRRELLDDPLLRDDPTLSVSAEQMRRSRAMPVVAELRAVWDAMRPQYQAILGGSAPPSQAAAAMQREALKKIEQMRRETEPNATASAVRWIGGLLLVALVVWQRKNVVRFVQDLRPNRLAYAFLLPSLVVMLLTVVFPFVYNVILSFSNMSMTHFRHWEVIGIQNYVDVLREPKFFAVFGKTIVWTVVNVVFHVGLGLMLAVALQSVGRGKSIYRVLLIIPWAVPAYITALTWRSMFVSEYGAVNIIMHQLGLPEVNWLGQAGPAFATCIITNVWLGFPFMMVVALGGMQGIPQELYEAARIDRASRWSQFWNITLPMLKPVLLPAITLGAIWTFNNLNVIWLVSDGGKPEDKTHILVSYVYRAVFNLYRYGYGAALSMVIFGILLAFSWAFLSRARATEWS